jgi:cobalt-zinc-cadmium resistance protein CzcA
VEGLSIRDAAREASEKRFRPVPHDDARGDDRPLPRGALDGIGSQTQKPLAVVVIGGSLILVAVVARAVQPPLLLLAHSWMERRSARRDGSPSLRPSPQGREETS